MMLKPDHAKNNSSGFMIMNSSELNIPVKRKMGGSVREGYGCTKGVFDLYVGSNMYRK